MGIGLDHVWAHKGYPGPSELDDIVIHTQDS